MSLERVVRPLHREAKDVVGYLRCLCLSWTPALYQKSYFWECRKTGASVGPVVSSFRRLQMSSVHTQGHTPLSLYRRSDDREEHGPHPPPSLLFSHIYVLDEQLPRNKALKTTGSQGHQHEPNGPPKHAVSCAQGR